MNRHLTDLHMLSASHEWLAKEAHVTHEWFVKEAALAHKWHEKEELWVADHVQLVAIILACAIVGLFLYILSTITVPEFTGIWPLWE